MAATLNAVDGVMKALVNVQEIVHIDMNYENEILFPPRPKTAVHPKYISSYEDDTWMAQPKLNGDCVVIYVSKNKIIIRDRHKKPFSKNTDDLQRIAKSLPKPTEGWNVYVGEWMIKSKSNEYGLFNKKIILYDLIVQDGTHLLNFSFKERYELLCSLFECSHYDRWIESTTIKDVYIVNSFYESFSVLFEDIIQVDMYEGFVLKSKNAKLEKGTHQDNNSKRMLKIRKETKNYRY